MRCSETNEGHIVPFQVIKQRLQLKESNGGHIAPPNEGLHAVMTRTDRQRINIQLYITYITHLTQRQLPWLWTEPSPLHSARPSG